MSEPSRRDQRLLRRALHRSRSTPAVVVLVVGAVVAAWVATECVLRLLDRPALLMRPGAVIDAAVSLLTAPTTLVPIVGGAAVLLGVLVLGLALSPGRRPRHVMADDRLLVVADDAVIASALARTARTAAALGPDRSQAWVARRRAQVRLQPTSGVAIEEKDVREAVDEQLTALRLQPQVRVSLTRSERERVA